MSKEHIINEPAKKTFAIEIPEGCFEGNCSDCVHANYRDKDSYGRVYCEAGYGYNSRTTATAASSTGTKANQG